jgi:hypothetical protein
LGGGALGWGPRELETTNERGGNAYSVQDTMPVRNAEKRQQAAELAAS